MNSQNHFCTTPTDIPTFCAPTGQSCIDFIFASQSIATSSYTKSEILNSCASDHFPLKISFRLPFNRSSTPASKCLSKRLDLEELGRHFTSISDPNISEVESSASLVNEILEKSSSEIKPNPPEKGVGGPQTLKLFVLMHWVSSAWQRK